VVFELDGSGKVTRVTIGYNHTLPVAEW
jgi:hypothetical protein